MIRVVATARSAALASDDIITSGSVGIPVVFELSEDFEELSCTAVFQGSGVARDVALIDGAACEVPAECLAEAGGVLRIGIYASNAGGTVVIPTVWASSRVIEAGTVPSDHDPAGPTPDWTAQVQAAAAEALRKAQDVQERADAGEFDGDPGISPSVTVTAIPGGHCVTITDAEGARDFYVLNGPGGRGIASAVLNADYTLTLTYTDGTAYTTPSLRGSPGEDGYSPRASVNKSGKAATITITDKQGMTMATVSDGEDGAPGISPTITVTDITGGHRVTITDATGPHSFDVMDGDAADAPVQDVKVNGQSVLTDGVAEIPLGDENKYGVYQLGASSNGLYLFQNKLTVYPATGTFVKYGNASFTPITPNRQHESTFYGLAKAAGDTTQSASSNAVGAYTDNAKSAIHEMLNGSVAVTGTTPSITALPGIRYICGEVSTLDITLPASGIVDVVFTSGSTPTVLTVTPPTGVTLKWAGGFDQTALDANTTYEINIADGLGVAASWT